MARTTPGVKLVDNLASFTDAYGTHKNFNKTAKKIKENRYPDSGSLGEYKYIDYLIFYRIMRCEEYYD